MIGSRYLDLFHNQEIYKNGVPEYLTKQNDYYFVENDELKYGELSSKLFYLIPDFLEQLLQQDFYIIADAFFETDEDIKNLKERFKQYNPQFIYFQASKETRDKREAERMDRIKGMSDRWLKSFKCEYLSDIMIDTDNLTPEEVAAKILNYLGNC
jgi:chloramphenicol 3-O-phosphotransferase